MENNENSQVTEPTISKLVDLPRLRVYDADLLKFETTTPLKQTIPIEDKNTYLGIEVEMENVLRYNRFSPYWTITEDGSLRNRGHEFVSIPIKAYRVESALTHLFQSEVNTDIDFSERTSIHIHMNIRTLTVKQLEALILLYILFEKVLFNFAGQERYENIFCTPLIETTIGEKLRYFITTKELRFEWQKYTALNLLPIMEKGTLEFRHLPGTKDINKIITWINLLLCLKKFALQKSPEYIWEKIKNLNTTSEYRIFGEEVFKEYIIDLFNDFFNSNMEECVSYIKCNCLENPFAKKLKEESFEPYNYFVPSMEDFLDMNQETIPVAPRQRAPRTSFNPRDVVANTIARTFINEFGMASQNEQQNNAITRTTTRRVV